MRTFHYPDSAVLIVQTDRRMTALVAVNAIFLVVSTLFSFFGKVFNKIFSCVSIMIFELNTDLKVLWKSTLLLPKNV